jgi:predicted PurR-regulated permease PerM
MRSLLGWVLTGVGGLVGIVGGVIVFLAFLFYMLQTREEWCDRTTDALTKLGMGPRDGQLAQLQQEIVTYIGCLSLVSLGYMVLVTLVLWAIGVPQPLLWGVLAGLLEFIPYFGPLIASVLPLIVSLSLGSWWQPAAVLGQYVGLHFLESYVVTPLVYGRAVRLNPVTILFAALFFGWIWGPVGLALATPMMILLRGLLVMSPHTPALDAFANVEDEKAEPQPAH